MQIINSILTWVMKKRIHQIELFMKYPHEVQEEVLKRLLSTASYTEFGRKYSFDDIVNYEDFKRRVPVHTYEQLFPHIERLMRGEQNILWPSEVKWFAKSSGTTNDKSKFIPVSAEALEECHFKGGKDLLCIYFHNKPESELFNGKLLSMGGSQQINSLNNASYYGDLSAILIQNLPFWFELFRTPGVDVTLMDEWENKIERMARITMNENVTNIAGVPSWMMVLLKRILELSGKDTLNEVWPNLELFVHGAVNFS